MKRLFLFIFLSIFFVKNASAQAHADCITAMDICKKSVYHIQSASGEGRNPFEALDVPCFENGEVHGDAEMNSTWFHWKIKKGGSLTFALTPHRFDDDLDFVVYRLPSGDCDEKIIVRCMASGDHDWAGSPCMGETGLRSKDKDVSEDAGCGDEGDNAWLAPLQTQADEEYALLVSNVTSAGVGFSIRFGGTAKLPCDEEKKPEPKPEPKKEPKKEVVEKKPTIRPMPKTIEKRTIFSKKTVEIESASLTISLFDDQVVDGDAVSVWLNDKKVIERVELKAAPQVFQLNLEEGENYLTVHAESFGRAPINTTAIIIDDGKTKQTLHLTAVPEKEESLKVVVKK